MSETYVLDLRVNRKVDIDFFVRRYIITLFIKILTACIKISETNIEHFIVLPP